MKKIIAISLALTLAICASSAFAATKQASATQTNAAQTATQNEKSAGARLVANDWIVSADWLKARLGKVVILDCRFPSLYATGHIPGAVNASWTTFVNTTAPAGSEKYGTILPPAQLAKKIGALGINANTTVVCYSDMGDWGQGGWTVSVLRIAGVKNVRLLDGGIYEWKQEKYPLTKKAYKNAAKAFSIKQENPKYIIYTSELKTLLSKPNVAIVDVRTPQEYSGEIAPFKEKRRGHIPGSINIPIDQFVTEQGLLKTAEEIQAMLVANGITKDTQVIFVDTCGVRGGWATVACLSAGFPNVRFYDSGFQAWAGDASLPLQ